MTGIRAGTVTAFFLFDAAESIDLPAVAALVSQTARVPLARKTPTPTYVQFQQPPLTIEGTALGLPDALGFSIRFKLFDYGVVSVSLTRGLPSSWPELVASGLQWQEDPRMPSTAESLCRDLVNRVHSALNEPRAELLSEDYTVFAVTELEGSPSADSVIEIHGNDIARLLRGEREALSRQERDDVLRNRLSYFHNDLLVPTWNAAFIYDTENGAHATTEVLEFANSQLLEFRYYDGLLDRELGKIYAQLKQPGWFRGWAGRRYTKAAQQVHALFIDVNELTDRAENALKVAGDIYAARVLGLTAARLGLDHWKTNVRDKLKTLDDIYRFAVEQTSMARGEVLELMIVLILIFELILFFLGIMR